MEDYRLPSLELLQQSDDICYEEQLHEVRRKAHILEETFRTLVSTFGSSKSKRDRSLPSTKSNSKRGCG